MLNAHDIAAHLLTATLRTGLSAECHGRELATLCGGWIEWGCEDIADAVDMVKRRVTSEIRSWLSDVLFEAALLTDGPRGRALSTASKAVLVD